MSRTMGSGSLISPPPALGPAWRGGLSRVLQRSSVILTRWVRSLRQPATVASVEEPPVLEFYGSACAPEGALYVDGQLVCVIEGVTRL